MCNITVTGWGTFWVVALIAFAMVVLLTLVNSILQHIRYTKLIKKLEDSENAKIICELIHKEIAKEFEEEEYEDY